MNTKHTPAPWTLASKMLEGRKHPTYFVQLPGTASFQRIVETQHEANARLIAAAPELLEALQAIIELAEDGAGGRLTLREVFGRAGAIEPQPEGAKARAAIENAVG